MTKNIIKYTSYEVSSTLTVEILNSYVKMFWNDTFKPLNNENQNVHLLLICKVLFDGTGHRTLADMRKVNYSDMDLFVGYITNKLGLILDAYQVEPISKIVFSYIIREGVADNNRLLLQNSEYKVSSHGYNNLKLPLTMDPTKFGIVLAKEVLEKENKTRYVVASGERDIVFIIDASLDCSINKVRIQSAADVSWIDTKLSDDSFKRVIGKNAIYVKDGKIVVKKKILPAKPFTSGKSDSEILPTDVFMTLDIETVNIDHEHYPYLICGYSTNGYIHSYAADLSYEARSQMFTNFFTLLFKDKKIRYVYAHNLSGFDGIFILKELVKNKDLTVKPIIFNGKIISINVKYKNRTLVFKDSYLLLPLSLRKLCVAFDVESPKGHFPFALTDINYIGDFPDIGLWPNITSEEYNELALNFFNKPWNFMNESIKYCELDCRCLFDILEKFNELLYSKFGINIHSSPTLPSLAMKLYKSKFMQKNTIYQLNGKVERDIRESYTGGAVDVFKPHNFVDNIRKKLFYYDVNSLYPYIMSVLPLPVGKPVAFEGNIRKVDPEAFGFFYCKIRSTRDLKHPILQRRIKTAEGVRTIAGLGAWEGWIYSFELDNAAKNFGYQFEILRGYKFERKVIFKEYIEEMYNLRQQYSKDNPMNLIAKLLMNSLYGKFGMKPEHPLIELFNTASEQDRERFLSVQDTFGELIQDLIQLDDISVVIRSNSNRFTNEDDDDHYHGIDVNVAIASAITAGARVYMSLFKKKNNPNFTLYYSDTDSIVINVPLPEYMVGNRLGQLKLEYEIKRAVFLAPKVYTDISWYDWLFGSTDVKGKGKATLPTGPMAPTGSVAAEGAVGGADRSGSVTPIKLPTANEIPLPPSPVDNRTGILGYCAHKISQFNRAVANTLNPFNYFSTETEIKKEFNNFMVKQLDMHKADRRYYPFTENNPYDSWFKKVRIASIGESASESLTRLNYKLKVDAMYDAIVRTNGKYTELVGNTPAMTPSTFGHQMWSSTPYGSQPAVTQVGIGINTKAPSASIWDVIHPITVENTIKSIPATPVEVPKSYLPDVEAWANYKPDAVNSSTLEDKVASNTASTVEAVSRVEVDPDKTPMPSTSKLPLDDIPPTKNPFNVLSEEKI